MVHTLNWKNGIAAAVALEAERVSSGQQPENTQGAAFKAEWDRRGADALVLCRDQGNDAARMGGLAVLTSLNNRPGLAAARFADIVAARA